MNVLNLDCESVHVLNISALSDTCTILFPQDGDSPLHYAAYNGHLKLILLNSSYNKERIYHCVIK